MAKDHARLTVLLDADRKRAFEELCAAVGSNPSEVVRTLIAQYLAGDKAEPSLLISGRKAKDEPPAPGK